MTPPPGRSASAPPGTRHAHQGEAPPGLRPSPTCKVKNPFHLQRVPCGFRRSVVGCDELGVLLSFLLVGAICSCGRSASLAPAQFWSSTYSSVHLQFFSTLGHGNQDYARLGQDYATKWPEVVAHYYCYFHVPYRQRMQGKESCHTFLRAELWHALFKICCSQ
ncbi:uncharacterized protein LOC125531063 isoform X1 [Triticum urartu]|uniref:uncharacterized protein LOC125531063 isoform X1 n=1 Tax=Triticum urartu TaxID=4572 RepID=UPI002043ABC1|nr:uncharacterized protein LOC125531063 isoform X1 [Triticum urartu]